MDVRRREKFYKINLNEFEGQRIAIYGIGMDSEYIITHFPDLTIECVIDGRVIKTPFCGKKVVSIEQAVESGIEIIIIAAELDSELIIYERIKDVSKNKNVTLYGVYIGLIEDEINTFGKQFEIGKDVDKDKLVRMIDDYDVITVDLFDTLITRDTYDPRDVFGIVENVSKRRGLTVDGFKIKRLQAELNVFWNRHTLENIYSVLKDYYGWSEKEVEQVKRIEVEVEKGVSVARRDLCDLLRDVKKNGKKIFVITDMYLPKDILFEILSKHGIDFIDDIFVSGYYGTEKQRGLFELFKTEVARHNCLHIGDNKVADGVAACAAGIDSVLISSSSEMLKASVFNDCRRYVGSDFADLMLGKIQAMKFSDVFVEDSYFCIDGLMEYVEVFIAPFVLMFVCWIVEKLSMNRKHKYILFGARDGYVLKKVYDLIRKMVDADLPESKYVYISRSSSKKIHNDVDEKKGYERYLSGLGVNVGDSCAFVDLLSSGTSLSALNEVFDSTVDGLFMSYYPNKQDRLVNVDAMFYETVDVLNPLFRDSNLVFEAFITAPEPSLDFIDSFGKPVFKEEYRSVEQIKELERVVESIIDYCEKNIWRLGFEIGDRDKIMVKEIWEKRKMCTIDSKVLNKWKMTDDLMSRVEICFANQAL